MKLNLGEAPYRGAPTMVLIAGLGGSAGYWQAQQTALTAHYRLVSYDQRGTGANPAALEEDYSLRQMAAELYHALAAAGISRFCVAGHALGALVGLQLALDHPDAVSGLALINGWLTLHAHTRRCFAVRKRLLHAGGASAWVEVQPLFLYPADWMAANAARLEEEEALALRHFQGQANLLRRLQALKNADYRHSAAAIRCPALIICARDDLLVPSVCSRELYEALPDSRLAVMERGGHACNVTDPHAFNALLLAGLPATERNHE